jgi:hypothetical protein
MIHFTCAILHKQTPERQTALLQMLDALDIEERKGQIVGRIFADPKPEGMPWAEFKTILAQQQWEWALTQGSQFTHHVFLTDDLHCHPLFWDVLGAMAEGSKARAIGLLSNHPRGPALYHEGKHAYRCNSWLVGPAYVVTTAFLAGALAKYRELPGTGEKSRQWFNDDSWLNEYNTFHGGGESWHPLPTIIEHRFDVESTVGHGDRFSRERVSWREERKVIDDGESGFQWASRPLYQFGHETERLEELMRRAEFWSGEAPMLPVGGE